MGYNDERSVSAGTVFGFSFLGLIVLSALVAFGMYGCPQYAVYQQRLEGQAELAKAQQNRQIAVQEAEAKKEAASALADAEIARAKGVAQANQIIADSLKNNEAYLRYLWVTEVAGHQGGSQVIYVPTEGQIPILEAGKREGNK